MASETREQRQGETMRRALTVLSALTVLAGCGGWDQSEGLPVSSLAPGSVSGATVESTTGRVAINPQSEPSIAAEGLFPDQIELPVMVYVNGIVYDLSVVPARAVIDIGQTNAPFAGPPVVTEHGLLVATGEGYDATLTLFPSDGRDPVTFGEGVGSFVLSADRQRLAWAGHPTEPDEGAALVEVAFPSGRVLNAARFTGFPFVDASTPVGYASVVDYVGENILLMTGDGAVATGAVWTSGRDRVLVTPGYGARYRGTVHGTSVVLTQTDGSCGVIVTIDNDGSVSPPDGYEVTETLDCWASDAPTFSPDGSIIASAGTDGEIGSPIVLLTSSEGEELARLPINGVRGRYFGGNGIHWLDNATLLVLASSWDRRSSEDSDEEIGIFRCAIRERSCELVQQIIADVGPLDFNRVGLIDRP